ncbi:hypothetical protein [Nostoc sp.]|uniref:hypothetical protein n=1 Tax=Nostoc sp. TaxID=1180 RepID=UPI002FFACD26
MSTTGCTYARYCLSWAKNSHFRCHALYSRLQLLYERLRQGEVQIIVGAQHVVPLPVYFIYLQYAV